MTEEEATRWPCIGPEQCGRPAPRSTIRYCIGSQCMAWRWIDPGTESEYSSGLPDEKPPQGEGWFLKYWDGRVRWHRQRPNVHGYCGLAGKPERNH